MPRKSFILQQSHRHTEMTRGFFLFGLLSSGSNIDLSLYSQTKPTQYYLYLYTHRHASVCALMHRAYTYMSVYVCVERVDNAYTCTRQMIHRCIDRDYSRRSTSPFPLASLESLYESLHCASNINHFPFQWSPMSPDTLCTESFQGGFWAFCDHPAVC